MDEREAVELWRSGEKVKVERAYQAVRILNPQIQTISNCEKQLARWNQEIHAPGSTEPQAPSDATTQEQHLMAVAEGATFFDDTTMLLLRVLADLDFDIYGTRKEEKDVSEIVAAIISGLISLVETGVNPKTAIILALESLRSVCIDSDGKVTPNIRSKIPEACDDVASEIMESNVVRDMTRLI